MRKAKRPGTPVNDTIKRSIKRNMRRGVLGSKNRPHTTASCDGPTASMTGLDLGAVNPNGIPTIAIGAWAWHVTPDVWFERWVPKPEANMTVAIWLNEITPTLRDRVTQALAKELNKWYLYRDWSKDWTRRHALRHSTIEVKPEVTHNPQ